MPVKIQKKSLKYYIVQISYFLFIFHFQLGVKQKHTDFKQGMHNVGIISIRTIRDIKVHSDQSNR